VPIWVIISNNILGGYPKPSFPPIIIVLEVILTQPHSMFIFRTLSLTTIIDHLITRGDKSVR
ncbi:hypothetical protein KA005_75625, partial [bacterium]|nr:hypothetical protein [bacterium]